MLEEKIKTQDLLNGLKDHKYVLYKLLNLGKEYNSFLADILESDALFDSNRIVHVTDVAQRLSVSSAKIRKHLEQIYDDIVEYLRTDEKLPIKPDTSKCSISLKDRYSKYFYISGIQLDIIPREGETIEISFLFPFFRYSHFEVNKVYYTIDYDVHDIHLELRYKLNRFARLQDDEDDYKKNMDYYDDEMNLFRQKKLYSFKKGDWKEL
jgi:hypothetical protein